MLLGVDPFNIVDKMLDQLAVVILHVIAFVVFIEVFIKSGVKVVGNFNCNQVIELANQTMKHAEDGVF